MYLEQGTVVKHLTTVMNFRAKVLDNGGQVDTVNLDFGKAFDTARAP